MTARLRTQLAALAAGCLGTLAVVAVTAPAATADTACYRSDYGHFDDSGRTWTAIGSPTADYPGAANSGRVDLRVVCGGDMTAEVGLVLPQRRNFDGFGTALVQADVNSDGYDDLLVGVPGYSPGDGIGDNADSGGVALYLGSADGLQLDRILVQGSDGVPGERTGSTYFGSALAVLPVPGDATGTLVRVGEPGKPVGSVFDAGGFVDLVFDGGGLVPSRSREVTLATPGIPWNPQYGDHFGASLYLDSTVGAPGRSIHDHIGAGAVLQGVNTSTPTWVHQDTPCMPGAAEVDDHFGATVAGQWIGVPGEDFGAAKDAGFVERYSKDSSTQCLGYRADSLNFGGAVRSGDRFGATLTELHTTSADGTVRPYLLLAGAPGADVGSKRPDAGSVSWIREVPKSGTAAVTLTKSGRMVGANPKVGLGTAIGPDEPTISAPGAYSNGGLVAIFGVDPKAGLIHPTRTFYRTDGVERGSFGYALMGASS